MTLNQALALIQQRNKTSRRRKVVLACGFEPLHLGTFLRGHFGLRFPDEAADIQTGLYGDMEGTLGAAAASEAEAAAVVIEWSDLDPRLGPRSTGGWGLSVQDDIVEGCGRRLAGLLEGLRAVAARMPVALVPPTLPISLFGHTPGWQVSVHELELQKQLAAFLAEAARINRVSVLQSSSLARVSPEPSRRDVLMELRAGFPYTPPHASAVASQVIRLLFPQSRMKGIVTDLDETLWSGIVGEVGVRGVSWSLEEHTAVHGLYQQMLAHLSEMGVLLAAASKNEPALAGEALRREDLLVPAQSIFPVCANWGPKSGAIAEILRVWNVGPESVVFVDDSAMEVEEVRRAFPEMTCLQFSNKPAEAVALLQQLRDLFGKPAVHREDNLRQASIRANAAAMSAAAAGATTGSEFIRTLQGKLTFDCRKDPSNTRLLELINKTNQFNLNGIRVSEAEWLKRLEDRSTVVVGVSYEDKFGPLGTIGVLSGRQVDRQVEVTSWVLSCRAFSRKIEDHMLDHLFNDHGAGAVQLAFRPTDRNQPLRIYLASLGLEVGTGTAPELSREQFQNHIEDLPHQVRLQTQ